MSTAVAAVAEVWRYPVKGMHGEALLSVQMDETGVAGDRRYAVHSSGAPRGKPLLTGAERAAMLLYRAQCQDGTTWVQTPSDSRFSIEDPELLAHMEQHLPGGHLHSLVCSSSAQTDVRPVSLLGLATIAQLTQELTRPVDVRRFRANLLLDMPVGFLEDALVQRDVQIGTVVLRITERIPRCRIVTLDPVTATSDPGLMKHIDREHGGRVGIYATVLQAGMLSVGDVVYAH